MALRRNPNQKFEQLKHAAAQARLPFDCEGWLNLAFYLDEHYVEWHKPTKTLRRIARDPRTPNAPRPTFNKVMHYAQQERALVLQAKPTVDVMPDTPDQTEIIDAEVSAAYCDYVAEPSNANFTKQLSRATLWAIVCYEGYLKWIWNPREGRPDIIPCSPFEVYSDPYARDFAKSRYVIHSQFMDPEQVYEMYGVEPANIQGETVDPMRAELLSGMGSAPVINGVTVNEIWYRPCRRYPKGLYAAWTGTTQLVAPDAFPYDHGRIPFTQIGCIERPDSKHYMSPVKYLRSPQMYFNRYMAQRLINRERFANYKWWIPAELELNVDPDDSPAQVLRGNSGAFGAKPEILAPPAMPDNGDGQVIEEQMMHIVGLHEVSQAQVPGRVEAAKAIEILKESDADRQQTTLDTITAAISEGFYQVLMLAKQYEPAGRMVQIYSAEGLPEVKNFKAANIKPGVRVRVTMGTGLAKSRAARHDELFNLWQQKIITDPAQMAELLDITHPSFTRPGAQDIRLARNENLELSNGIAVQANSWDDHAIHLKEHNDYRKTAEFRTSSKKVRERFEFHCNQHEDLFEQFLATQARRAIIAQGGAVTGDKGGSPPPPGPQDAAAPADETATAPPPDGTVPA